MTPFHSSAGERGRAMGAGQLECSSNKQVKGSSTQGEAPASIGLCSGTVDAIVPEI